MKTFNDEAIKNEKTKKHCPTCGRFVSQDLGFYAPVVGKRIVDSLDVRGADLMIFCDEQCTKNERS